MRLSPWAALWMLRASMQVHFAHAPYERGRECTFVSLSIERERQLVCRSSKDIGSNTFVLCVYLYIMVFHVYVYLDKHICVSRCVYISMNIYVCLVHVYLDKHEYLNIYICVSARAVRMARGDRRHDGSAGGR